MQCSDTFIKIWALDFMPDKARAIRDLWCGSWNFCTQGKLYIQPHAKQIHTNTIKIHYTNGPPYETKIILLKYNT